MASTLVASITLTVTCETPAVSRVLKVTGSDLTTYSTWECSLTNQSPQLGISLAWSANGDDYQYYNVQRGVRSSQYYTAPHGVRSFRIVSRDGGIIYSMPINGATTETKSFTAKVDMASVQVKKQLDFDIVLSTAANVNVPSKPGPKTIMSSLLKDIATMNMAFTFGFNNSARNVALWAHQSILSQQPSLSSLMGKLPDVEGDPSASEAVSGVKTTHVTEYSLEAYCALVRYIYTSEIKLEVDLDDFSIGCPPNKPLSPACKKRPTVDGLFAPAAPPSSTKVPVADLKRTTTWQELFSVADCYDVKELRSYCRSNIVESINHQNVLEVLFQFGYKYDDVRKTLLAYVAKNMDKLFTGGGSKDPFEAYKDHPERYSLLIQALQVKFGALA
ncbi:hypothetical protein CPC16_006181 [Podila verticillata]|nr:hypothetical protein CPC16_006181 [Podila verticillata]KAI9236330.1 MAG: hypothetical protein BYD32DRAFT_462605 [Podila humilis]